MNTTINSFVGEHGFLSNSYPAPILVKWGEDKLREHYFPTTEHFYQFMKHEWHFLDKLDSKDMYESFQKMEAVQNMNWYFLHCTSFQVTPGQIKRMGKKIPLRYDWEDVKLDVMKKAVRAKFGQHADLADRLIKTHPLPLIEGNTWGDKFWGVCDGEGENYLGRILTKVRSGLIYETRIH